MCLDGMFQINGTYYSFAADGKMQTGWVAHGLWYYFDPDTGAPAKGWKELNHTIYYFDESNGYMVTGRRTIDDEEYCFNSDGSMHTGWYKEINKWADDNSDCIDFLYFDPDGKLHKKWLTVDGKPIGQVIMAMLPKVIRIDMNPSHFVRLMDICMDLTKTVSC